VRDVVVAVKYATDPQVEEAILRWRGKVVAAAEELGIQPKNLRKRLERLGIDLDAVRAGTYVRGAALVAPHGPHGSHGPTIPPKAPMTPPAFSGRKSGSGPYSPAGKAPIFGAVQQAAVKDGADDAAIELPVSRAKQRPIRFHPQDQDRLREARLDIIAKHRVEIDETAIHHDFFQAKFAEYMAERLAPEKGKKR
jgi:hypothetical protein